MSVKVATLTRHCQKCCQCQKTRISKIRPGLGRQTQYTFYVLCMGLSVFFYLRSGIISRMFVTRAPSLEEIELENTVLEVSQLDR